MKVYLVWERESYCDYDVVFISFDDIKAKEVVEQKKTPNVDMKDSAWMKWSLKNLK
jgi:hypothetical protein